MKIKQLLALALALMLCFSFVACNKDSDTAKKSSTVLEPDTAAARAISKYLKDNGSSTPGAGGNGTKYFVEQPAKSDASVTVKLIYATSSGDISFNIKSGDMSCSLMFNEGDNKQMIYYLKGDTPISDIYVDKTSFGAGENGKIISEIPLDNEKVIAETVDKLLRYESELLAELKIDATLKDLGFANY